MTTLEVKQVVSIIATIITIASFYPYIRLIRARKIKPHVFSWIIWGMTTLIAFIGQIAGQGGIGTLSVGVSAITTFYVAYLAFRNRADLTIHKADWMFLVTALLAIPVWMLTSNPLWAIVIITIVDMLGFGPTFRNVYANPKNESAWFYMVFGLRNGLAIYAMEAYNWTTILFPAAIGIGSVSIAGLILIRKGLDVA